MADRASIRVLVADDHPFFRLGLAMALRGLGYGRVDEAVDGQDAIDCGRREDYDVVVLDLRMPRRNGIEAAHELCRPADATDRRPIAILLTTFDEPAIVRAAEDAGVSAYVSKETEPAALARIIDDLLSGRRVSVMPSTDALPSFSVRELEVLRRLADGWSVKEVADGLAISAETVKDHVSNLYGKLDVRDRVSAVREARRLGLLLLDEFGATRRDGFQDDTTR